MHDQSNEDASVETYPVHDVDPVQDFVPLIDHFTTGRLPQTEQETKEYDTTATIHTTEEPVVHSTAIPPTISTSVLTAVPSGKFFLDVCSGVTRPLSMAILDHGHPVLSFDILLDSSMDILSDAAYEDLLRVAASGQVGYGAASPSCCEYSRLKLRDDGGPKALRSPDHLSGLPNLTSWELQRVQESFMMLSRCVEVLTLVFQAGGHVHLEQPLNAMSWLEKVVRQFLQLIGASCLNVAACAYEMDVYKAWMFASSFPGLRPIGCTCQHPPNSHVRLQGLKDDSGAFASRATAQYPQKLAQLFATLVAPLLDTPTLDLQWSSLDALMPIKRLSDYPFAQIDGGGAFSHPDWSQDQRQEHDWFKTLRTSWMNRIISARLDKILLAHVASGNPSPPFSMEILTAFRDDLEKFLLSHGQQPDCSIRQHQPMHLHILHSLQRIMHDVDFTLLPSLLEGVRTGFSTAIPPSGIFPPKERADTEPDPLSAHLSN